LISSADVRLKEVAHLRAQAELAEAKKKSQ
jgi:hypothetical protein